MRVFADTNDGLTGSEIAFILNNDGIPGVDATSTEWERLYNAVATIQNDKGWATYLLMVVTREMNPVRYINHPTQFERRRQRVNALLRLTGIELGNDSRIRSVPLA